jgi:hypothetical protein
VPFEDRHKPAGARRDIQEYKNRAAQWRPWHGMSRSAPFRHLKMPVGICRNLGLAPTRVCSRPKACRTARGRDLLGRSAERRASRPCRPCRLVTLAGSRPRCRLCSARYFLQYPSGAQYPGCTSKDPFRSYRLLYCTDLVPSTADRVLLYCTYIMYSRSLAYLLTGSKYLQRGLVWVH